MVLYDHPDCPYATKVRVVLAEKDLSYETETVDLSAGEQRSKDFLRLNPFGKVPVLVDEGVVIYDSAIINEYLNDEYPHPPLLPEESGERALTRMLGDFADHAFTLPAMAVEREMAKRASERDERRIASGREVLAKTLAMLEDRLEGKEYLAGEFSLADAAFAPTALNLNKLGTKVDTSLPNVRGWVARLTERPSVGPVVRLVA